MLKQSLWADRKKTCDQRFSTLCSLARPLLAGQLRLQYNLMSLTSVFEWLWHITPWPDALHSA